MFPLGRPSLDGRCGTYAIAAKIAHPDRPVIALVGDGAMQMNNMGELITVAKYWREWSCPNWVVCIFNNGDFNQVTWEQRVMEGDPKFNASQPIPDVPYHRFAESIGLRGIYLDSPDRLGSAWDCGFRRSRPGIPNVFRAPFQSDAAHQSNLMAPRVVSSRRPVPVIS